jgi:stage V sporulation protein B
MTKQTKRIIQGTLILSVAGLMAKILSAFYRIPLINLVGDEGIGYYNTVYPFYSILTAIALVGIPNVVSKLVAEEISLGRYKQAQKTFKDTFVIIACFSVVVSLGMFCFADTIIAIPNWNQNTRYVIYGFAISPVFVAIAGTIRGYFQGMQIMKPSAISQVIENLVKVIVGLSLVVLLMNMGMTIDKQIGGAAVGASVGFIISAMFLVMTYLIKKKEFLVKINEDTNQYEDIPFRKTAKTIIFLAVPVTIAASAYSIMNLIDSLTIYRALENIGYSSLEATERYGQMGKAFSIINVPLTISVALSASIVPAISEAVAKGAKKELNDKISQGLKLAALLSLPSAAGLIILAEPIFKLLYPNNSMGYEFLQIFSVCLVFMIIGQTLAGILQGISRHYVLLISIGMAILVKVLLNLVLIPTFLEARGAALSSIIYYIVFVGINYIVLRKEIKMTIDFVNHLLKPLIASVGMGVCVYLGYKGLYYLCHSNALSVLGAVLIGVIVYGIILIRLKVFAKEDFEMIPKSNWMIRRLEKKGLL